jgi:hypothetical protein
MRTLLQKSLFESRRQNDLYGAFLDAVEPSTEASREIIEDTKQIEYTYRQSSSP